MMLVSFSQLEIWYIKCKPLSNSCLHDWCMHSKAFQHRFIFFNRRPILACENICFSPLFATGDVLPGGTSATQRQKFHTDDANQCLRNKSGSQGVLNINLSNFMCLLVDFGIVLCSSTNELQQNSNSSSREDYIPQIKTVLWEIPWHLHLTFVAFCLLSFVCQDCHS